MNTVYKWRELIKIPRDRESVCVVVDFKSQSRLLSSHLLPNESKRRQAQLPETWLTQPTAACILPFFQTQHTVQFIILDEETILPIFSSKSDQSGILLPRKTLPAACRSLSHIRSVYGNSKWQLWEIEYWWELHSCILSSLISLCFGTRHELFETRTQDLWVLDIRPHTEGICM